MNIATDLDNETKEKYGLLWAWNKLSDFLHHAELIPFIVVVSGAHIFQVLIQHDKWWSSIPLAGFLDLLHYRTVKKAVETGAPLWWLGATLTTVGVFMFQFIFYSLEGADGATLEIWKRVLFGSIVPIGIIFMVWHHHENEQAEERDLIAELSEAKESADSLQQQLNEAQASAEVAQKAAKAAQTNATEAQQSAAEAQDELNTIQLTSKRQQGEIDELQTRIEEAQAQLDQLKQIEQLWNSLNPKVQSAAKVNLGLFNVADAVVASGVTENTIRSAMKYVNGHK